LKIHNSFVFLDEPTINILSAGRPEQFKADYIKLAYQFCLLGATDEDLAKNFEVSVTTLNNWKIKHPEFLVSIKKGKEQADAEVASKLFHRATGYQHDDIDIKMYEGQIIETPLIKHYPPDTTAAIFWLKNRQPAKWRDKQDITHDVRVGLDREDVYEK